MIVEGIFSMAAVFTSVLLAYGYHFFMVRALSPELYGTLSLVIAVLTIMLVPTASLQSMIARDIAKIEGKDKSEIKSFARDCAEKTAAYGALAAASLFILSYPIARAFASQGIGSMLRIISLSMPAAYVLSAARAYFQGTEKTKMLWGLMIGEPAIKLVSAVLLVYAGLGVMGASASLVAGPAIILLLGFLLFRPACKLSLSGMLKLPGQPVAYMLATNVVLTAFLYLDLFLVNYYLGSAEAGFYNASNMTAKVLMYAAGGVTLILLPKTSRLNMHAHKSKIAGLVLRSVMLLLPLFIMFMAFPRQIISVFYTKAYAPAIVPFEILAPGMFAYAIAMVLLNLSWSQNKEKIPFLIALAILPVDAALLLHFIPASGLAGAALATTISSLIFLAAIAAYLKISFGAAGCSTENRQQHALSP